MKKTPEEKLKELHASPEKEIVIYFANGNKAKFKVSKVTFGNGKSNPTDIFTKSNGKIYVNLDTVCFIREWEDEPRYDD